MVKDIERLRVQDRLGALVIILLTLSLSALVIVDRSAFGFFAGPLLFTHWISLIGGFWIAIVTPVYYFLKHRHPEQVKEWVRIHMFGNLVAFMLISVHFTYWIISVSFIGTGTALFFAVATLVMTGLLQRFNMLKNSRRQIRFLHVSMTTAFYLILAIHILSHMMRL